MDLNYRMLDLTLILNAPPSHAEGASEIPSPRALCNTVLQDLELPRDKLAELFTDTRLLAAPPVENKYLQLLNSSPCLEPAVPSDDSLFSRT